MQHGRKLAQVARADFERDPHHPYYELLARSVPELRRGWLDDVPLAARPEPPWRRHDTDLQHRSDPR